MGEDSTFVALLQPVPPGRNAARLWVAPNGVIAACDPTFVANFGWVLCGARSARMAVRVNAIKPRGVLHLAE